MNTRVEQREYLFNICIRKSENQEYGICTYSNKWTLILEPHDAPYEGLSGTDVSQKFSLVDGTLVGSLRTSSNIPSKILTKRICVLQQMNYTVHDDDQNNHACPPSSEICFGRLLPQLYLSRGVGSYGEAELLVIQSVATNQKPQAHRKFSSTLLIQTQKNNLHHPSPPQ